MPEILPAHEVFDEQDINAHKHVAALGYVWMLWLVPLLLKRDSAYAQYHAKQGLVLFIAESLMMLISWLPVINVLAFLGLIILAVIGITNAIKGVALPLPVIGRFVNYLQ